MPATRARRRSATRVPVLARGGRGQVACGVERHERPRVPRRPLAVGADFGPALGAWRLEAGVAPPSVAAQGAYRRLAPAATRRSRQPLGAAPAAGRPVPGCKQRLDLIIGQVTGRSHGAARGQHSDTVLHVADLNAGCQVGDRQGMIPDLAPGNDVARSPGAESLASSWQPSAVELVGVSSLERLEGLLQAVQPLVAQPPDLPREAVVGVRVGQVQQPAEVVG